MSTDFSIITSYRNARLKLSSGKTYPLSGFSFTFQLNSIPKCTCVVPCGRSLSSGRIIKTDISALLDLEGGVNMGTVLIDVDRSRTGKGDSGTKLMLGETAEDGSVALFKGTLTNASVVTSARGSGGSSLRVSVTLEHPIADLYAVMLRSYVYATGAILRNSKLSLEELSAENFFDITYPNQPVGGVEIDECFRHEKGQANIVSSVINYVNAINQANQHVHGTEQTLTHKAEDYLEGDVRLSSSIDGGKYMESLLKRIYEQSKSSDILSTVFGVLTDPTYMLMMAPTLSKVRVMPNNTWISGSNLLHIPADAITMSTSTVDLTPGFRGADAVVVTSKGDNLYWGGDSSSGVTFPSSAYPPSFSEDDIKYRLKAVSAPPWLTMWYRESNPGGGSATAALDDATARLRNYAKLVYASTLMSGSAVNLNLNELYPGILDYLGTVVSYAATAESVEDYTGLSGARMYGLLSAYTVQYSADGENSAISSSVVLSSCRNSATQEKLSLAKNPLYS